MSALAKVLTGGLLVLGILPSTATVSTQNLDTTSGLADDFLLGVPSYIPRSITDDYRPKTEYLYLPGDGAIWPLRKGEVKVQVDSQWLLASLGN